MSRRSDVVLYAEGATIDPKMPFVEKVQPLMFGDIILIRGHIPQNSKGFAVNLKWDTNTVLHVNPRFPQAMKVVVLNTHWEGKWGKEQRISGTAGLRHGAPFSASILVQTKYYKVAFNGNHVTNYEHVLPHEMVSQVTVEGDVTLKSFRVDQMEKRLYLERPLAETGRQRCMPPLQWNWDKEKRNNRQIEKPVSLPGGYNLAVPYSVIVPGGIKMGRVIYMTLIPGGLAKSFRVVIKGSQTELADVMMKMEASFDTRKLTFNNKSGDREGKAVELDVFPFRKLCHADVLIRCAPNALQVSVNNSHIYQFPHRVRTPSEFQALEVTGETGLLHVRIQ